MQKRKRSISFNPSILDVYLIKQLVPSFIFSIIICSIVAELVGISFEQFKFVAEQDLTWITSLYIHFLKIPTFIIIALPYAILFSTLFTYSQISRNSEVIALQTFGISLYRLALPALVLGLLASIMMFGVNELIVPSANYKTATILEEKMNIDRNILHKYHKKNIIYKENSNQSKNLQEQQKLNFLIYAERFNGEKILNITILNFLNNKLREIIICNSAQWYENEKKWQLTDGEKNLLTGDGNLGKRIKFKTLSINNISRNLWVYVNLNRDNREMNINELSEKLKIIKNMGNMKEILKLKMAIYRRYTNSSTCLIFALLGCSSGISIQPRIKSINRSFNLVIFTIIIRYILDFLINALCISETIPIFWGVWIPNLVAMSIAVSILIYNNNLLLINRKSIL